MLLFYIDANLYFQKAALYYLCVYNYLGNSPSYSIYSHRNTISIFFLMTFYNSANKSCRLIVLISVSKLGENYVRLFLVSLLLLRILVLSAFFPVGTHGCYVVSQRKKKTKLTWKILSLVLQWVMKSNNDFFITIDKTEQKLKPVVFSVFMLWGMAPSFQGLHSSLFLCILFWTEFVCLAIRSLNLFFCFAICFNT